MRSHAADVFRDVGHSIGQDLAHPLPFLNVMIGVGCTATAPFGSPSPSETADSILSVLNGL